MCVCMTTATNFPTLIQSSPIHRPAYDISPESASVPDLNSASFTGEHKIGLLSPVHMGCYLFPSFEISKQNFSFFTQRLFCNKSPTSHASCVRNKQKIKKILQNHGSVCEEFTGSLRHF